MTRLPILLAFLATPAFACPEGCGPPPAPPPPVFIPGDGETMSHPPLALPCSFLPDGRVEFKAPMPTDASKAKTERLCRDALAKGLITRKSTREGL